MTENTAPEPIPGEVPLSDAEKPEPGTTEPAPEHATPEPWTEGHEGWALGDDPRERAASTGHRKEEGQPDPEDEE